jgi:FkbM family methyltransferase
MKLLRFAGYFIKLCAVIGFFASIRFTVRHILNRIRPAREGKLASVPVGPYVFYFPSLAFFESIFTEIFFKGTYYLDKTNEPIQAIDCGANIGVSLLYIKTRAPLARVICFEPNPAARAVLEKNIEANHWESTVQVFPYALGSEKGAADFFVDDTEATSSSGSTAGYEKNKKGDLNSYTVAVDILSHYIESKVDFLKIDIEGGEFDVLEELTVQNALRYVNALQLEYHYIPQFQTRQLRDLIALLQSAGFSTFVQPNTHSDQMVLRNSWHTYMVFARRNSPMMSGMSASTLK